jgi:hypothetical protein
MEAILFHKEKDADIFQQETFHNLDLDASEMAMLELLVLCDSSRARRGFYDDLLTLLR